MDSSPPRLLFVVNHSEFFISHRLPIALAAQEQGFRVHVATGASPAAASLAAYGITWHELPLQPGGMNPVQDLALLLYLRALYKHLRPHVVHHVTLKPVLYGGIAARWTAIQGVVNALSGLGYIFMTPGIKIAILRGGIIRLLRYALGYKRAVLILQNRDDVLEFTKHKLVDAGAIRLIRGSGTDLERFIAVAERQGTPVVVLPSRLLWDKGVGEFVEAARLLKTRGVNARFALVGGPDTNNPTSIPESQIRQWKKEGIVEVWGHRKDMPDVFAQAHLVCLPSYREGLPKALIEAAACGRAIVSTDVPGCREIVSHGENGLLVPAQDSVALADAMQRLLEHKLLRAQMGLRGRQIVEDGFALENVVNATLEIYESLLERNVIIE